MPSVLNDALIDHLRTLGTSVPRRGMKYAPGRGSQEVRMPLDAADAPRDSRHLRHELFSALTIIQSQTRLLQRHVRRMSELGDDDRQQFEAGLTVILTSSHELGTTIDRLPALARTQDTA